MKPTLVAALLALAPALMGDMRQDEFLCEEAYARLVDCCPGFPTTNSGYCTYAAGCDGEGEYPALTIAESTCVRETSCSLLVSSGVCDRAAAVHSQGGTTTHNQGVCP